jgi:hypothetical protein
MEILTVYPHRRNRDGSFDSICPTCYATVARSKPEAELAEIDEAHICDSAYLAERGSFCTAEAARRLAMLQYPRMSSPVTRSALTEALMPLSQRRMTAGR